MKRLITIAHLKGLPPVLTCQEVADLLRIHRTTAYQMIEEGRLPCIGRGKGKRVPTAAVLALLGCSVPEDPHPVQSGRGQRCPSGES